MVIRYNLRARTALHQGNTSSTRISKSLKKLSSGLKLVSAADGAADLAISEKMRAKITGLSQAQENANNGILLVQTAEGALSQSHTILLRMEELALQSMNGICDREDRKAMDGEFQQLLEELDRIAQNTQFNGISLLDGSLAERVCQKAGQQADVFRAVKEIAMPTIQAAVKSYQAVPTASTIVSGTDIHITTSGRYELAAGFTGTVTIDAGLQVTLAQSTTAPLRDVGIQCGAGTELTLDNLHIENDKDMNAIDFTGAGNRLILTGNNSLISKALPQYDASAGDFVLVEKAVIHVASGTELVMDGSGSLTAQTEGGSIDVTGLGRAYGQECAVIGGNNMESGGAITINGGAITAISKGGGAAIGGGTDGNGGVITINDGVVNAYIEALQWGDCFSAAIGGGGGGGSGTITINGGTVKAYAKGVNSALGAAIGSGSGMMEAGKIEITGGDVYAMNEHGGAAIGSGAGADPSFDFMQLEILISGGTVHAENTAALDIPSGAAIGGGIGNNSGKIVVSGGDVTANTRGEGAAIGGGSGGSGSKIQLTGGTVQASTGSQAQGAAIGGGQYGDGGTIEISGATVDITIGNDAYGAAIGGGKGCYNAGSGGAGNINTPGRPGCGADLTIDQNSTVTIHNGWIGGGRDEDSCDFGLNGNTKVCTDSVLNIVPPYVVPIDPPSHFLVPPSDPTEPPITYDPVVPPNPPDPPDPLDPQPEICHSGGLILQIGTENAEYDRLRIYIDDMTTHGMALEDTDVQTMDHAEDALNRVHGARGYVSINRGRLGAYINRLSYNMDGNAITMENMTSAESSLRNADMAYEMLAFTKEQVLSQAAQALLAQNKQSAFEVLTLLK